MVTLGAEDNMVTAGTSVEPYESGLTAAVSVQEEGRLLHRHAIIGKDIL